ncbi:uncharacterized protein EI97DRAFT_430523 [Westerdykella ornata]|uniref:Uncharacterized protein n=1 Tax=Westerdykella ornata TaxID=318751 RepID=A0A6A6JUN3_WESOR|nr:uncharacterized protein EI97DRAFT_430523 [Westerdykella ornata]KAF2279456.1 hypothetical protein EI97DRAFT_430523 [Westerdykella ornata]
MATTCPSNKTLAIVGSGANTVTGNLVYKFGGIDLRMLAKLQEKGINSYDKAAQKLKDTNEELYFYTPRHRVTVKDHIPCADSLLVVVTPPIQASEPCFTGSTLDELKESAPFFARRKAVILIVSPEGHDSSEGVYNNLVRTVRDALQQVGISADSTPPVPVDLHGGGFIEPSPKTPWYTGATLMAAMDEIFS